MGRPLGPRQIRLLQSLIRHGSWHAGAGWTWAGKSETARLLRVLAKRGYVVEATRPGIIGPEFTATAAGREIARKGNSDA